MCKPETSLAPISKLQLREGADSFVTRILRANEIVNIKKFSISTNHIQIYSDFIQRNVLEFLFFMNDKSLVQIFFSHIDVVKVSLKRLSQFGIRFKLRTLHKNVSEKTAPSALLHTSKVTNFSTTIFLNLRD